VRVIRVRYSCAGRGLYGVIVDVPERTAVEDAIPWTVQALSRAVGDDHARRSPFCMSRSMQEVIIPPRTVVHDLPID